MCRPVAAAYGAYDACHCYDTHSCVAYHCVCVSLSLSEYGPPRTWGVDNSQTCSPGRATHQHSVLSCGTPAPRLCLSSYSNHQTRQHASITTTVTVDNMVVVSLLEGQRLHCYLYNKASVSITNMGTLSVIKSCNVALQKMYVQFMYDCSKCMCV